MKDPDDGRLFFLVSGKRLHHNEKKKGAEPVDHWSLSIADCRGHGTGSIGWCKARHSDRTLQILNAFLPKRPYLVSLK